MRRVAIGLLGLGTVGAEVARLLRSRAGPIGRRAGAEVALKRALVRDPAKARDVPIPDGCLTTDYRTVTDDPEIAVVVELLGGIEPARSAVLSALAMGKDVVTANKALLAEHGAELFAAARKAGRSVAFEGAVGGGIPIVGALGVGLAANRIASLSAILNGTCNFILTSMAREGLSYAEALRRAQRLGYAEADPTLDVDGTDTAHKLAILAQLAFGASVTTDLIPRRGIDTLQPADIQYADELGYTVKLLAVARDHGEDGLELGVAPRLVRRGTPLAEVAGPYNAVRVVGEPIGDALFYGQGAGREADCVGRPRRPDRRRQRPIGPDRPIAGPLARSGPPPGPLPLDGGPEPRLPPLHHRRPPRRHRRHRPDPRRPRRQHRQRHPARPRRRRPPRSPRPPGPDDSRLGRGRHS